MKSGLFGALAVIAVAMLAVAGVALGKPPKKFDTEVEITSANQGTLFEGNVTSDSKKCLKERDVTLIYDTTGSEVGTAETDANGEWSIPGNFTAGLYHAEVSKEKPNKRIKCLAVDGVAAEF